MINLKITEKNRKTIKSRKRKTNKKSRKNTNNKSRKTRKTRKTRKNRKSKGGAMKFNFKDSTGLEHLMTSKDQNLGPYKRAEPSVVRINDYICIKDSALEDMNNLLYELFIRRFKERTNTRDLHRAKSLSLKDFFKQ